MPILLEMKRVGIRIDEKALHDLTDKVQCKYDEAEQKLIEMYGITGEMINSSKQLGARFNEMNIQSPVKTKTGAQSWSADALARIHHPVIPLIQEFKNYDAILNKYLHGSLSRTIINGRIHCTFVPMLRDQGDGGTVTGRFSCKNPNLQQIPARNKGHGDDFSQDMRALFLPEEGQMLAAMDYSQIEAVLLGHFAQGPQADWFREQLRAGADLHNIAMDMTGITYRPVVKTFNYGCIYGMGWRTAMEKNYTLFEKFAKEKNEDIETFTKDLYNNYHKKFPVIKDTMEWCQNLAKLQGYIDTMGGRRLHKPKPQYDPVTCKINDFIYKMLNKLIQGTAADILKQALVTAYEEGIYDILTLHLLVHDEQVNSVPFNKVGTEAAVRLQEIMAGVYKDQMLVPIKAACELGPNWGYWSGDIYEQMKLGNFDPAFFNKDYKETH
jgi:DNA polymerase-1